MGTRGSSCGSCWPGSCSASRRTSSSAQRACSDEDGEVGADLRRLGVEAGLVQPAELLRDTARQIDDPVDLDRRVFCTLGHDDVAEHEAAAGAENRREPLKEL